MFPTHRALIKHLAIRFSTADLTPYVLDRFEDMIYTAEGAFPDNYDGDGWAFCVVSRLQWVWGAKLEYLRRSWEGLDPFRGLKELTLEDSKDRQLTLSSYPLTEVGLSGTFSPCLGVFMFCNIPLTRERKY